MTARLLALGLATVAFGFTYPSGSGVAFLVNVVVWAAILLLIAGTISERPVPRHRAPRCSIDEEWQGSFIGRRWCRTHEVYWDGGGSCPYAGQPFRRGVVQ